MRFLPSTTLRWLSVPALVGLLSLASTPAGAQWTTNTSLPDRYSDHSLVYSSGFLYHAGGISYNEGDLAGYHVFYSQVQNNGMIGAWNAATPLPANVFDHAGVAANGFVYVLGGFHSTETNYTLTSVVYYAQIKPDGSLDSWQTATPLPQPLFLLSASVWNERIYAICGANPQGLTNTVYSAKIQTNGSLSSWVTQTPMPAAIYSHASVANGMLYALGGAGGDGTVIQNKIYYSRINADGTLAGWNQTTNLPQAISNLGAVVANGRIFTIGGWDGASSVSSFYSAAVNGDGSLGAWSAGTPLPQRLHSHGLAASDSHIIVSGGINHQTLQGTVYSMPLPPPPASPALTSQGIGTNGSFQLQLASVTNTGFGFLASTNLTDWTRIGWGFTGTNGLLSFQDTNAASFPLRFYRAFWPLP